MQTLGIEHAFSSFIWLCGPITGLIVSIYTQSRENFEYDLHLLYLLFYSKYQMLCTIFSTNGHDSACSRKKDRNTYKI